MANNYTIYHIPGIKIGCTNNIKRRIKEQGYNEYTILEEHTDIETANKREKELQKEYGYKVETNNYINMIKTQKIGSSIGNCKKYRKIAGEQLSKTIKKLGLNKGHKNPNARLDSDKVNEIRQLWNSPIKYSKAKLGRMFGVSEAMIRYIVQNKNWV